MGGVPKEEYPYRNGPMRSSPPNNGELVPTSGSVTGPARPMQQGAVMMVYGLCKDKINAERLFNIFCLYGNVVRVSGCESVYFLRSYLHAKCTSITCMTITNVGSR